MPAEDFRQPESLNENAAGFNGPGTSCPYVSYHLVYN